MYGCLLTRTIHLHISLVLRWTHNLICTHIPSGYIYIYMDLVQINKRCVAPQFNAKQIPVTERAHIACVCVCALIYATPSSSFMPSDYVCGLCARMSSNGSDMRCTHYMFAIAPALTTAYLHLEWLFQSSCMRRIAIYREQCQRSAICD